MTDLTQLRLEKLLQRLNPDRDRAAEQYNKLQHRLIKLFQWAGCSPPEKYAQEVINRVTRRMEEGEAVLDLDKYVNAVAKFVLKEAQREQVKEQVAYDLLAQLQTLPEGHAERERRDACFRECMQSLPVDDRRLVAQYFQGEKEVRLENRRRLAETLQISPNTLSVRCFRIRAKLKVCVRNCIQQ